MKQTQNIFAFFQVYPYSIKHPVLWLSCIVNIGLAVALIPVNVLILATTEDQVLNLFIYVSAGKSSY